MILKVSSSSKPTALAGAIIASAQESGSAELQAIGAGAVNQAVKAAAIANEMLSKEKKKVIVLPEFIDIEIGGEVRSGIRMTCIIEE